MTKRFIEIQDDDAVVALNLGRVIFLYAPLGDEAAEMHYDDGTSDPLIYYLSQMDEIRVREAMELEDWEPLPDPPAPEEGETA